MFTKLKFLLYILCLCEFSISEGQIPDWDWAKTLPDIYRTTALASDEDGNVFVCGYFFNSLISGTDTFITNGYDDIFISKYNVDGNLLWTKSIGSNHYDFANSAAIDENGSFYITGAFAGDSIAFGAITLNNYTSLAEYNYFIAKYDNNGNILWAKKVGGPGEATGLGITCKNEFVYTTGWFTDSVVFGSTLLTCNNNVDVFVVKYDTTGNVIWAKNGVGTNRTGVLSGSQGNFISIDGSDNICIAGTFNNPSLSFDTITINCPDTMHNDIFIVKYDASGNTLFAKRGCGPHFEKVDGVMTNENGDCFVVGTITSTWISFGADTMFNAGGSDMFFVKYDSLGNLVWNKRGGGAGFDRIDGCARDEIGNLYITGRISSSTLIFDSILVSNNDPNFFIAKYDHSGNPLWVESPGDIGDQYGFHLAVSGGNIYTDGIMLGSTTSLVLGVDTLIVDTLINPLGVAFIAKLGNCDLTQTQLSSDTILCNNQSVILSAPLSAMYLWNTGDTTQQITIGHDGIYSLNMADSLGCIKKETIAVTVYDPSDYQLDIGNDFNLCIGMFPAVLQTNNSNFMSYGWSTGDTTQNTIAQSPGAYYLTASYACGLVTDSVIIDLNPNPILNLGADTIICNNQSFALNAPSADTYLWSTGDTSQQITLNQSGNYHLSITDSLGCSANDSISVIFSDPIFNLGSDTILCNNQSLILTAPSAALYQWNTGATTQQINIVQTGSYNLSITDSAGCVAYDTIQVTAYDPADYLLALGNDVNQCADQFPVTVQTNNNNFNTYHWNTGVNSQMLSVTNAGAYYLTAGYICGSVTDTITIGLNPDPVPALGNDTVICEGKQYIVIAHGGVIYHWNTGDNSPSITVSSAGIYSVNVINAYGCSTSDQVEITYQTNHSNLLPYDTTLATGGIIVISAAGGFNNYFWNDGTAGQSINIINEGIYIVNATDNEGCRLRDSIIVTANLSEMIIPTILFHDQPFHIINLPANCNLKVYDAIGQLIYSQNNYKNDYYPVLANATYFISLTMPDGKEKYGKLMMER